MDLNECDYGPVPKSKEHTSRRRTAVIVGDTNLDERRQLRSVLNLENFSIKTVICTNGVWSHLPSREAMASVIISSHLPHNIVIELICEIRGRDPGLSVEGTGDAAAGTAPVRDVVYDPYYENSDIRSHVAQQDSVLLRLQGREFEHGASSSREPPSSCG